MAKTKYGDCIVTLPISKIGDKERILVDAGTLNGFACSISYGFAFPPASIVGINEPHVHDYDEAVFFIGSDPPNMSDLGAEVEFTIGAEGEEEKHVFDKPTAVVIPKGLPHCPVVTRRVDKPFLFMAVSLTAESYTAKK